MFKEQEIRERMKSKMLDAYKKHYEGILSREVIESSADWLEEFISPYFDELLHSNREAVIKEFKVRVNESVRQEDESLTDETGVSRDYLAQGWNLGLGRSIEIILSLLSPNK